MRQIYALAAALCERADEAFPETFEQASELIERLRLESGHPTPRLADALLARRRARRRRRGRGRRSDDERRADDVAAELVREMG